MKAKGIKTNAARASHPSRIVSLISLLAFPPLRSGEPTVPVRQRSPGVPHLPALAAESRFGESFFRSPCGGQRTNPLHEREGEEAAVPGQSARTHAHFRFPLAIHPRESPAATSVTANHRSTSVERSNVFAGNTLVENIAIRNRKPVSPCAETVDEATSLWKPEEKRGGKSRRRS